MGATRFFIFSTFLALMFGFALSLPTVGNEDPEQGKYKPYYLSFPVAYENSLMIKLYVQRSYSPIKTLYLSFPHFNFYPELKIQTFQQINHEAFKYGHNILSPRSLQRHGVWSIHFFFQFPGKACQEWSGLWDQLPMVHPKVGILQKSKVINPILFVIRKMHFNDMLIYFIKMIVYQFHTKFS